MWQPKVKTIAALQKGLIVLDAITEAGNGINLQALHAKTAIPKATLLRLLLTLEQHGLIWRRLLDGAFFASHTARRPKSSAGLIGRLAEYAGDELETLQAKIQWPSDLAVRRGNAMTLCETNRNTFYMSVHKDKVGFEVSMLRSAVGRAYLAFCPDDEREQILAGLRKSRRPGDALARDAAKLNAVFAQTRQAGYGRREPTFGGNYDEPRSTHNDKLTALAVPILKHGGGIYGCLNIVWIESLFSVEEMADKHLAALTKTASRIARKMALPR